MPAVIYGTAKNFHPALPCLWQNFLEDIQVACPAWIRNPHGELIGLSRFQRSRGISRERNFRDEIVAYQFSIDINFRSKPRAWKRKNERLALFQLRRLESSIPPRNLQIMAMEAVHVL